MKTLFAFTLFAITVGSACAQDHPGFGIVYNTTENNSLNYECRLQGERLHCDFVQTRVVLQAKPEDLDTKLMKARADFQNIVKEFEDPKACNQMQILVQFLQGDIDADQLANSLGEKDPSARISMEEARSKFKENSTEFNVLLAMMKLCQTRSLDDYLSVVRLTHEQETQTCLVSSYRFQQQFKRVASGAGSEAWVVDEGPQGECGIVQLSRFEADRSISGAYKFWDYISRKAVTLPDAETVLGKCGETLDEKEYRFSWKDKGNIQLGCKWIKFSAF